jgi:hypothetical protein
MLLYIAHKLMSLLRQLPFAYFFAQKLLPKATKKY